MGKKYIEIPEDLADNIKDEHYILEIEKNSIKLRSQNERERSRQQVSLRYVVIPTVLVALFSFIWFYVGEEKQVPFTGNIWYSIEGACLVFSTFVGFFSFIIAYLRQNPIVEKGHILRKIRQVLTLTIAYNLLSLGIQLVIFYLLYYTFRGVSFDVLTSTVVVTVFSGSIFYFLISAAVSVDVPKLITLLTATFLGGTLVAMITNSQRYWWKYNFSFLGTKRAQGNWLFNVTLIFAALILLVLTDFLFSEFAKSQFYNWRIKIIQAFYYVIALLIACIGAFTADKRGSFNRIIHDNVAYGLVITIMLLMIVIKLLLPEISREFMILTIVTLAVLVISTLLFMVVKYFSLTFFEIIAFAIAFAWLIQLVNELRETLRRKGQVVVAVVQESRV